VEEGRVAENWAAAEALADIQQKWSVGRWGAVARMARVARVARVETAATVEVARVAAARVVVRGVMAMAMATGLTAVVAEMPVAAKEAA
jgi:hypothetical protein